MDKRKKVNFYDLLEVDKKAPLDVIKTQYRKLALVRNHSYFIFLQKWHPDKNNNSEESTEKFKLISEAYSGN